MEAIFSEESTYREALENTDKGLMPLAVRLFSISDHIPNNDYKLNNNFNPVVLGCCTTVFNNDFDNGKWGWTLLEADIRKVLGNYLLDRDIIDEWVYFSQRKVVV